MFWFSSANNQHKTENDENHHEIEIAHENENDDTNNEFWKYIDINHIHQEVSIVIVIIECSSSSCFLWLTI